LRAGALYQTVTTKQNKVLVNFTQIRGWIVGRRAVAGFKRVGSNQGTRGAPRAPTCNDATDQRRGRRRRHARELWILGCWIASHRICAGHSHDCGSIGYQNTSNPRVLASTDVDSPYQATAWYAPPFDPASTLRLVDLGPSGAGSAPYGCRENPFASATGTPLPTIMMVDLARRLIQKILARPLDEHGYMSP